MKKTILLSVILICTIGVSFGQWTYTNLSSPKESMGVASLGSKAYFAGGNSGTNALSLVESYNVETGTWDSTGNLSIARRVIAGTACGSKLLFAGGVNFNSDTVYSRVDIYDIGSGSWSVQELSLARMGIAAVSKGSKVLFAGGCTWNLFCTNIVDIYNISTGSWDIDYLPIARGGMASAVVGNLAVFAGGFITGGGVSAHVDIYDFALDTWSTANLSEARVWASAVTVNDKVIIAGGLKSFPDVPSDRVDIFNSSDGTWTTATLSEARAWISAGAVNDKAYFAGGSNVADGGITYDFTNAVDVYDDASNSWYNDVLDKPRQSQGIAIGDYLIVAGGTSDDGFLSSVEIFHDPTLIHVPADYSTIQNGINAASDGDTVIVAENTYYENINFFGKALLLTSEFILDKDTNHISNTIIDGSQPADPDLGSVVTFTSGEDTTSVICGFTITGGTGTLIPETTFRAGGGVFIQYSGGKVLNNHIEYNEIINESWAIGGGVCSGGPITPIPWVVLRDNRINHNKAISTGNDEGAGGGIQSYYNLIMTNNDVSYNEVEGAWRGDGGGARLRGDFGHVDLTVINNRITHNKAKSVNELTDLVISGGLDIFWDCSGIVANNDISFNVAEVPGDKWCYGTGALIEMITSNDFIFENNLITGNNVIGGNCMGGGLCIYNTGGKFQNNVVQNNKGTNGGGIGVGENSSDPAVLINNTIIGNEGVYGGGLYASSANAVVMNTIIWGNTAPTGASIFEEGSSLELRYSDVEGDEIWPGTGNKNEDPQFLEDGCHIDQYSPCEDQGADSVLIGETWYYAPETDLEGTPRPYHMGIDMGAYECDIIENIPNPFVSSDSFIQVHVSPNPFKDHTTISYNLESDTQVEISLYNSQGSLVRVLLSGTQAKGSQILGFDGADLPAGIYYYQLRAQGAGQVGAGKIVKY